MKSKIRFNNLNIKSLLKKGLILFIVITCVYLLYLNDLILVQSIIQNSLSIKPDTIVETFNVNKYVDICKSRETRFYDFRSGPLTAASSASLYYEAIDGSNNCENLCDTVPNCQAFMMRENSAGVLDISKCYMYIAVLDSSNIDRSSTSIKVNCNSKMLPASSYTYNGSGYINKKYFENNKSKFSYIDIYLDKANELVSTLRDTKTNLNSILSQTSGHGQLISNLENNNNNIGAWLTSFGNLIGVNPSTLFSINNSYNPFTDDVETDPTNIALNKLYAISKDTPELSEKIVDIERDRYVDNLFYTILAFIMVITIILLVLYRLNDNVIISDRFMIFYFIVIVTIFTFIRFMLNK